MPTPPCPHRAAAWAADEPLYSTGRPCRRGHSAPRRTDNAACTECLRHHARKQTIKLREKRMLEDKCLGAVRRNKETGESFIDLKTLARTEEGVYAALRAEDFTSYNTHNPLVELVEISVNVLV